MSANSRWATAENVDSSKTGGTRGRWTRGTRGQSGSSAGNRGRNYEGRSDNWWSHEDSTQSTGNQNRKTYNTSRQQKSPSYRRESPDIERFSRQMSMLSTSESTDGMRKSKRNWDAEHQGLKLASVQDAPLISRTTDREDNMLRTEDGQRAMWQTINDKIESLTANYGSMALPDGGSIYKKELEQVIDLFRKLREAVFATKWADNDITFSIQVFELSSTYCAIAGNMGELLKSLKGLVEELYPTALTAKLTLKNQAHYTALYILYHVCYTNSPAAVIRFIQPGGSHPDLKYAVSIMNSILHYNYYRFFQLCKQSSSPAFTSILNMHVPSNQELACKVLSVAYYNTSVDWAKETSNLADQTDGTAINLIQRWSGGRVERVDEHRLMWFKRGKKVHS
ncbi:hypothetical protein BGW37DRAFT_201309 [Umbelopsis sp. PMI_123]|nr:hypothetical protein BGW37DRAFT_201309 [Umbelopsis sp. PMI_123]